ncbi:MAG: response regulator [Aquisalimonadaceae bacterium]
MDAVLNVLVVDDELSVRESLIGFLADTGMAVDGAENGEQALQLSGNRRFDVAVVDMRLPDIGGERLVMELIRRQPTLRFLIHTGMAGYQPSPELSECGVTSDHVYCKPLADLECLVDGILALRGRRT